MSGFVLGRQLGLAAAVCGWLLWCSCGGPPSAEGPEWPRRRIRERDGAEMVLVKGGTFTMGPSWTYRNRKHMPDPDEPEHSVTLTRAFYVDAVEVTVAQFRAFCEATSYVTRAEALSREDRNRDGCEPQYHNETWRDVFVTGGDPRGDLPVVMITWDDASEFAKWVGARLPTEAEWEYCATVGSGGAVYPWGNAIPGSGAGEEPVANLADETIVGHPGYRVGYRDGWRFTAPVGSFGPNLFGIHDLGGNVAEWCLDSYAPGAYRGGPRTDPIDKAPTELRVIRGASWENGDPNEWRPQVRRRHPRGFYSCRLGFRCVVDLDRGRGR